MASSRRTRRNPNGSIRLLPSGRYQARSTGPDGKMRPAPATFATRREADDWLAGQRTDVARGTWAPPELGQVRLGDYFAGWLASRVDLAPRTVEMYRGLAARWFSTAVRLDGRRRVTLADAPLSRITPTLVREWQAGVHRAARDRIAARSAASPARTPRTHPARTWAQTNGHPVAPTGRLAPALLAAWTAAGRPEVPVDQVRGVALLDVGPNPGPVPQDAGRTQAVHAYRLLRAVLTTAVAEGMIPSNPCRVPRAAVLRVKDRRPATPADLDAIAAAMPPRYSAAVPVAAWSALRAGELFALRRRDVLIGPDGAVALRVERAMIEIAGAPVTFGPPKSDAGRRTVHLPAFVGAALVEHLAAWTAAGPDALIFGTATGRPLRGGPRGVMFRRARQAAGRPDLRWHDLRHTGATAAARTGASLKALQRRLGHSTVAAAMIYQAADAADDARIAAALDASQSGETRASLRVIA